VIKSSLIINQTTNNWMKAKINAQEVKVKIIITDYIKLGHEGVQLLIEYYNAISIASTHKIYTKTISIVPRRPYSFILIHCGALTQCLKWRPKVFIYRNILAVLSPTFGAQPQGLLHKWVSFSAQPLALVLSTWPFLLRMVFLVAHPHTFGL